MKLVATARKENASISGATSEPPVARSAARGSAPAAVPAWSSSSSPLLPRTAASQARNMSRGTAVPSRMACLHKRRRSKKGMDASGPELEALSRQAATATK